MSLYTIMDIDYIMDGCSLVKEEQREGPTYQELDYKGIKLEALCVSNNKYIVNRIISTDPRHYLIEEIQPGAEIELIAKIGGIR
ncbi:MAG TPA: YlzJ-like family protein [Bacillota bacterium]|nr:YlzJ-like family protein [Bacillota bacterium]